ncbi:MAG: hypothetical protein ACYC66_13655 [Chloroflexota bacterium]
MLTVRSEAALRALPLRLLAGLRSLSLSVRVVLGFALGAGVVAVALPLLGAVGISFAVCPTGWESFAARVVAVWIVAAVVLGVPSWLLALDPIPLTVLWSALALLWKFGPQLALLLPG